MNSTHTDYSTAKQDSVSNELKLRLSILCKYSEVAPPPNIKKTTVTAPTHIYLVHGPKLKSWTPPGPDQLTPSFHSGPWNTLSLAPSPPWTPSFPVAGNQIKLIPRSLDPSLLEHIPNPWTGTRIPKLNPSQDPGPPPLLYWKPSLVPGPRPLLETIPDPWTPSSTGTHPWSLDPLLYWKTIPGPWTLFFTGNHPWSLDTPPHITVTCLMMPSARSKNRTKDWRTTLELYTRIKGTLVNINIYQK